MANFTPNQNNYKNLTPFKTWLLLQINTWGQNNFPFVESDFDELTNYGMMQKLMKALNDVISNENMVEEDMTNLYNAFTELQTYLFDEFADYKNEVDGEIEQFETSITNDFNNLQNYVDNFFDNNFPQMISDKLDEMAEDGTLENLLNDTAHLIKVYNTYTEMLADSATFTDGLRLKTMGYYSINDGGNANYFVNNQVVSSNYQIDLQNGLYLNLLNPSNVNQFGAYGDGVHDDTTPIQNAINYFSQYSKDCLHLLQGTYLISTLAIHNNINIIGCGIQSILKSIDNNNNDLLTIKDAGFNYVTLKSFKVDGNKANSNSTNGILIDKTDVPEDDRKDSHVTIKDVMVADVKGNGIYNNTGGRGNIIDNCIARNCDGYGILFGASDSIIINTNCMWNKLPGIWVRGSAHRVVNTKCYCNGYNNDSTNRQDLCGILITGINTNVDSCECQENYGDGIVLANNSNQLINIKVDRNGQKVITYDGTTPVYPGDSGLVYAGIRVDRYYRNAPVHYCTIIASATDHGRATNTQLQKTGIEIDNLQNSNVIMASENQVVDVSYGNGWSINLAANNTGAKNNVILNGRLLGNEFSNGLSLKNVTLNNGTKYNGILTFSNDDETNELASLYKMFVDISNIYHFSLYDKNGTWKSNLINANITNGECAISFFNRVPQTQMNAPSIPTDLQSCIAAIASLIQILTQYGLIKTSS